MLPLPAREIFLGSGKVEVVESGKALIEQRCWIAPRDVIGGGKAADAQAYAPTRHPKQSACIWFLQSQHLPAMGVSYDQRPAFTHERS